MYFIRAQKNGYYKITQEEIVNKKNIRRKKQITKYISEQNFK